MLTAHAWSQRKLVTVSDRAGSLEAAAAEAAVGNADCGGVDKRPFPPQLQLLFARDE